MPGPAKKPELVTKKTVAAVSEEAAVARASHKIGVKRRKNPNPLKPAPMIILMIRRLLPMAVAIGVVEMLPGVSEMMTKIITEEVEELSPIVIDVNETASKPRTNDVKANCPQGWPSKKNKAASAAATVEQDNTVIQLPRLGPIQETREELLTVPKPHS